MLLPRVCDHIHKIAAVAQFAQLIEREKRCARKIRLHA
jgi:hypothetical protein